MKQLPRLLRLAVLAVFAASAAGCCIAPWGHGPRGYGGYYRGEAGAGYAHGGDMPRGEPHQRGW